MAAPPAVARYNRVKIERMVGKLLMMFFLVMVKVMRVVVVARMLAGNVVRLAGWTERRMAWVSTFFLDGYR